MMQFIKSPIRGKLVYLDKGGVISQYFGENYQWYHDNAGTNGHDGLDIATHEGDEIYASIGGKVVNARFTKYGGNSITTITPLESGIYLATLYCHLSSMLTKEGENVSQGQIIGTMGHTGEWCFGTHLHFALHLYSDPVPNTQQLSYPTGESFTRLNYENGFKGALNPLFYFEESFMKYIIIGKEQYLLYEPLKLAFNIGDPEELKKLTNNGLVGSPINTGELPTGYLIYPLVDKSRLKDIFGL
jgi:murein DD-endopeptidase MepM/ murein hydrolase activator NlpD